MTTEAAIEHDEDADLETADDGSKITSDHQEIADERERDERGRFVSRTEDEQEAESETEEEEKTEGEEEKPRKKKAAAEAEEETEGEEEPEEEGEEEEGSKPNRLGRRISTITAKNRALEQRARELEAELAAERVRQRETARTQKSEVDTINETLDTLYVDVEKARADGDTTTAATLQRQIDAYNRRVVELETTPRMSAHTKAAVEGAKFNDLLDVVESRIPELNNASRKFDRDAAREMEFQIQAYERMGMTPSNALRRATLLLYGVDLSSTGTVREPVREEEPAPKKPLTKPTNVARNLDAAGRGVPKPGQSAPEIEEGRVNVESLTDEEFDALPESKLDELGGNVLKSRKLK